MVRHGVAKSGGKIHIELGVEIKRPSQIFGAGSVVDTEICKVYQYLVII
jgi:hypothetical protein